MDAADGGRPENAVSRLARDGAGGRTFQVRRAHGVWQVLRDGVFYGDYPVRQSAIDAANAAACLPVTRASPAEIVVSDEDA